MAAFSIVGASGAAGASPSPGYQPLAGSVAPFAAHETPVGAVAASKQLTIQVWMKPREAAAQAFASSASTPGSAQFRHYLSPDAYTARFGATRAAVAGVESWLRGKGFTGVHADAQRTYVRATGNVAAINAAFRTRLERYRRSASANAGPYQLFANATPVSVPSSLSGGVLGITGLDNAAPLLPLAYQKASRPLPSSPGSKKATAKCSFFYGQNLVTGEPPQFGTTTFPTPNCGYNAHQVRGVYGANFANTGKGQTIALIELGLTKDMFLTLQDYAAANPGLPAPSSTRYAELSLGRGTACGDFFDIEEQLDVEVSYDMAPAASQLVVGGDSCNNGDFGLQGIFNADIAVLNGAHNRPLASVSSNSWESGTESQAPLATQIENAFLVRAAAEGVGMYFSSGDASGVEMPSSDPFAISVGGTTVGVGVGTKRLFETGWSDGISLVQNGKWGLLGENGAAGGGPSVLWKQPSYQKGVVPPALSTPPGNRGGRIRSAPDISALADPFTGFLEGVLTFPKSGPPVLVEFPIGGTSVAAPLVGGVVTAAEQGQHESFGFINPALYRLAGTSAFVDTLPLTAQSNTLFRAILCPANLCGLDVLISTDNQRNDMIGYTGQKTLKGYDNMSGIGVPNGQHFIAGLRRLR